MKLLKLFVTVGLGVSALVSSPSANATAPVVEILGEGDIYSIPTPPYKLTWSKEANKIAVDQIDLLKTQLLNSMAALKQAGASTMTTTYLKNPRVYIDPKLPANMGFQAEIFQLHGFFASGKELKMTFTLPKSTYPLANNLVHPKATPCALTTSNSQLPLCSAFTPTPKEYNDGRLGELLSVGPQNVLALGRYAAKQLNVVLSHKLKYSVKNGTMNCPDLTKSTNGGLQAQVRLNFQSALWGWTTKINAKTRTATLIFNKPNLLQAAKDYGLNPAG